MTDTASLTDAVSGDPAHPSGPDSGTTLIVSAVSGPVDDGLIRAIRHNQVDDGPLADVLRLIRADPAAPPEPTIAAVRSELGQLLEVGPLRMDLQRVRVTVHRRVVQLAHQEFLLLKAFMENAGRVLSRANSSTTRGTTATGAPNAPSTSTCAGSGSSSGPTLPRS